MSMTFTVVLLFVILRFPKCLLTSKFKSRVSLLSPLLKQCLSLKYQ